jgi:molybdopterin-guanine dinucleotide biosynthesis protein A
MEKISLNSPCLGVVLAGGLSSRMGQDKAKLMRNQQDMLSFSKQLLLSSGVAQVVVSGNQHQVADLYEKAGPVAAISSVIKKYRPQAMLILPVDLPLMTSAVLSQLKTVGELSGKACYFQDHQIPLYLPVNAMLELSLDNLFKALSASGKGPAIKSLLGQMPCQCLPVNDAKVLFNSNTPEQWQQAKKQFQQTTLPIKTQSQRGNHVS